ncbi:MAG: tetratricopeptide repeat protein [Deltaproteobacteria bacterium]|nr:tetratricopeptide repeat protein [Deltaproteobacteria bacterium]
MKEHESITKWLSIGCIAAWGVVIYSNTMRVPFVFDDLIYIHNNPILKEPLNFARIILFAPSRWLGFFTFSVNYYFGQWNTIGYHLFNLMIHIGSAVCCYSLVLLTLRTPRLKNRPIEHKSALALLAALIFLSHPVQTEAVTYVWQRVESLAAFFYLLSLTFYVKSRLDSDGEQSSFLLDSSSSYMTSCLLAYACAMTKETAVTLPAMIIVYEIVFFENFSKRARQVMLRCLPFLCLLIVVPALAHMSPVVTKNLLYESPPLGTYVLTQTRVIATYLRLLVWPTGQNLDYDFPLSESLLEPEVMGSILLIMSVVTLGILVRRSSPLIAFGIIWFFVTLSPTSSIVPLPDVIFEHRLYLPLVGFVFVLAGMRVISEKRARMVTTVLIIMILIFSASTYRRNSIWRNDLILWQDTVEKSPHKARPRANLATSYIEIEEYDKALAELSHAISLKPDYAVAYENVGVAYFHTKAYQPAIAAFQKAIELDPNQASAYNARGEAYARLEKNDLAIKDFHKALSINPYHLSARNNFGLMLAEKGEYLKAIAEFETVVRLEPNHREASFNLARAYTLSGQVGKATRQYEKIIELEPGFLEAYHNLGILYLELLNKPDEAKRCLEHALRLTEDPQEAAQIKAMIAEIEQAGPKPKE